jgi:hypothetical protein
MLTYQLRERSFLVEKGATLDFPNKVYVEFLFCPTEALGKHSGKGKTLLRGSRGRIRYDANTGRVYVDSEPPLKPLNVTIKKPNIMIKLRGNRLHIRTYCETVNALVSLIETLYYGLPPVLNLDFAESPIIKRVTGKVGKTTFCWAQKRQAGGFEVTDQEIQEGKIDSAWCIMELLNTHPARRRILAALQHFYVACRLSQAGNSPSDFMAEVILNYCKILEVLFPSKGDGKTREAVRIGLAKLDYSKDEIESNFMPAMALRNEIDVGHIKLSLFDRKQLNILHKYTDAAEGYFRSMLRRLTDKLKLNNDLIEADPEGIIDKKTADLIRRIGAWLPKSTPKGGLEPYGILGT